MIKKIYLILILVVTSILLNRGVIFSQEVITPEQAQPASEPEVQWLWGEVVSVDTQNKAILVKYLDYETENEKEINIIIDDKTTYENVNSIDELKPQDTVSIDYIVNPDGKNLAENISLEKPESQEPESKPVPQEEAQTESQIPPGTE